MLNIFAPRSPSVASTNLDDFFMPPARRRYVQAPEIFSSFSSKTVDEGSSGRVSNEISLNEIFFRFAILKCLVHKTKRNFAKWSTVLQQNGEAPPHSTTSLYPEVVQPPGI